MNIIQQLFSKLKGLNPNQLQLLIIAGAMFFIVFLVGLINSDNKSLESPVPTPVALPSETTPEEIEIRINVKDNKTQEPIQLVKVQFDYFGSPSVQYTDSSGYVDITISKIESVNIYLSKEGYASLNYSLTAENISTNQNETYYMTKNEAITTPIPTPTPTPLPLSWVPRIFKVVVESTKEDGKKWDSPTNREPDIAICISSENDKDCLPGNQYLDSTYKIICDNSYECLFSASAPDGDILLNIIDKDLQADDTIGSGFCAVDQTCNIGRATVSISPQ